MTVSSEGRDGRWEEYRAVRRKRIRRSCGDGWCWWKDSGPRGSLRQTGRWCRKGKQSSLAACLTLFLFAGTWARPGLWGSSVPHACCGSLKLAWSLRGRDKRQGKSWIKLRLSCRCSYSAWYLLDKVCETESTYGGVCLSCLLLFVHVLSCKS